MHFAQVYITFTCTYDCGVLQGHRKNLSYLMGWSEGFVRTSLIGQRDVKLNYLCHDTYTNKTLNLYHTPERTCLYITETTDPPDKAFLGSFYRIQEVPIQFSYLLPLETVVLVTILFKYSQFSINGRYETH